MFWSIPQICPNVVLAAHHSPRSPTTPAPIPLTRRSMSCRSFCGRHASWAMLHGGLGVRPGRNKRPLPKFRRPPCPHPVQSWLREILASSGTGSPLRNKRPFPSARRHAHPFNIAWGGRADIQAWCRMVESRGRFFRPRRERIPPGPMSRESSN